eukprot:CAMPEP_0180189056 /NCGR_PEP_ID=MMETSP0987-20121128/119_1 /TAXON_ID=697907 /ORGANISM="non described non described, Strain CCMP2293" /LENGTH=432 /DNA_ID=CAMNT_0022143343 /DNA_START=164 /DNA_END=1459 /DNA_ORIENTATION=-
MGGEASRLGDAVAQSASCNRASEGHPRRNISGDEASGTRSFSQAQDISPSNLASQTRGGLSWRSVPDPEHKVRLATGGHTSLLNAGRESPRSSKAGSVASHALPFTPRSGWSSVPPMSSPQKSVQDSGADFLGCGGCPRARNPARVKGAKSAMIPKEEFWLMRQDAQNEVGEYELQVDLVAARNIPDHKFDGDRVVVEDGGVERPPLVLVSISVLRTDVQPPGEDSSPGGARPALPHVKPVNIVHRLALDTDDIGDLTSPRGKPPTGKPDDPHQIDRPQFRSRPAPLAPSIAWGERFVTREAERGLEYMEGEWSKRRAAEPKPLTGGQVVVIVSMHCVKHGGEVVFLGTATLDVQSGTSFERILYLQSTSGLQVMGRGGLPTAVKLKVEYTSENERKAEAMFRARSNTLSSPNAGGTNTLTSPNAGGSPTAW